MKVTKRRGEQFQFYDYTGIEAHLKRMAMRGWQLQKINNFYWEYRKIEPQRLSYTVTYFSEASEFNPHPTENQQTFYEYCKDGGWNLVTEWAQMQIFCTEQENPIPIETEEPVKLKAIHNAMKKNFLPSNILVLLLALFQIALQLLSIMDFPVSQLSSNTTVITVAIWGIFAILILTNLIGYVVWYHKSKKNVNMGGACIESGSRYKGVYYFRGILGGSSIVLAVYFMSSLPFGWAGILGIVNITILITLVLTIKKALKRAGVSRRVNLSITILSCVVLSFALTGAMAWVIIRGVNVGWFDKKPVETYTATMLNGYTHTWDIYHDRLPLKVEDLQTVNYDHYSYEWKESKSFLLEKFDAQQRSFPDGQHAPELSYEIVNVKLPLLFDLCLNDYLEKYSYDFDMPEEMRRNFRRKDDPVWKADAVYQLFVQEEAKEEYILCWGNRIVNISFSELPNIQQIAIVVEKLSDH